MWRKQLNESGIIPGQSSLNVALIQVQSCVDTSMAVVGLGAERASVAGGYSRVSVLVSLVQPLPQWLWWLLHGRLSECLTVKNRLSG